MWLVSVSLRERERIVPTEVWTADDRLWIAEKVIDMVLDGRGDKEREREFRMNITLCRHRAASDGELDQLPCDWKGRGRDIAGGPVAVLWSSPAMPTSPGVMPCEAPRKRQIPALNDERLWIPIDCGSCEPCQVRERSHA